MRTCVVFGKGGEPGWPRIGCSEWANDRIGARRSGRAPTASEVRAAYPPIQPIPFQQSLLGARFYNQVFVFDPAAGNAMGAVVSDAAEGVVGG